MRLWLGALIALTVLRLVLAATLPLAPDEAYYFIWSQHLQAGYFDHPPMVALLIRAGTALFGDTPFGIRFMGPVCAALGSVLLWDAGERMFPQRRAGLVAALLLNATLLVGVGAIVMTPDTALLFFWTMGIAALARLVGGGDARWWLAVGLAAGCALLSKYTALLLVAAVFLWLVTAPEGRRQLRTIWPWAAMGLAVLVFAPDIFWNAAHGWVSYFKQGGRVARFDAARSGQYLAELLGSQAGLATPIIFGLAVLGVWRLGRSASGAGHLLVWLTVVPGAVFLEHVISGRVEGNWVAILYPSACLSAAALPGAVLGRWLKPALALGFGLTALVYAQALAAPFPLPARADPVALQFAGWKALGQAAGASNPGFLTSDDYATAAALAYYAPASVPVVGTGPRWRYFSLPQVDLGSVTGVLVTRGAAACPDPLGMVARRRGAEVVARYRLCRVSVAPVGVLLPRP